ncbi:hypothetical protein GCM10009765_48470 [Fodinicola feengrottensis]|uniref:NTP pyrophosphohydrolase n=1 Tax=Fodinicola feengrottensis TaxID=435914 RepID=A0ABN2HU00_9ACTN
MERIVVVDGANVVGSRPDGWWKDRVGAARRLRDHLEDWIADQPEGVSGVILVVEGAARPVAEDDRGDVYVLAAPGSGDDTIVERAEASASVGPTVVVTADRALRERVHAVGAETESPSWLWSQLDAV